jgi:hypothetical protein
LVADLGITTAAITIPGITTTTGLTTIIAPTIITVTTITITIVDITTGGIIGRIAIDRLYIVNGLYSARLSVPSTFALSDGKQSTRGLPQVVRISEEQYRAAAVAYRRS